MEIGERLNFNSKVMEFCFKAIGWKHNEDQEEHLNRFADCVGKTAISEQLFRAEFTRMRPGLPEQVPDDD
jgi:hypothetical protein